MAITKTRQTYNLHIRECHEMIENNAKAAQQKRRQKEKKECGVCITALHREVFFDTEYCDDGVV